ncbi:peptidyl-prolyl cis-trans isomerase Pin1-like [Triticum dicoccoides]|uniref:peptidyl-prolyl cis-trans isomerase Pin1-like n=1 Tax=Triticum dicoccoides TaxID=85692 RepID=UPI0018911BE6|nr:peptidyl-prolyl cis-trans isomerase Pin1-like [Triticum dicoccoides]
MAFAAAGKEMGRASYIRLKHGEERREASWKAPEGRIFSATTRTDVAARLGELRDQILAGCASFTDLAAQHSDCSSARRGGDLATLPLAPLTRFAGFHIGSLIMANRKHQPRKSSTAWRSSPARST